MGIKVGLGIILVKQNHIYFINFMNKENGPSSLEYNMLEYMWVQCTRRSWSK